MKNLERTVEFYIDRAIERSGATSDRKLCELLDISHNAVMYYRNGRSIPSDDTMVRLAQICGIDPAIALTDLNIWKTDGLAQKAYRDILKKMTSAAIALIILVYSGNTAFASNTAYSSRAIDNHSHSIIETIHYHIKAMVRALIKWLC